jgi:hypothetical protein
MTWSLWVGILLASFSVSAQAASYNGADIDGQSYSCSAYSSDTSNYYDVDAEFDGDTVKITFSNGGWRVLTLDDEDIDDADSISATDPDRGTSWELDCSDLD